MRITNRLVLALMIGVLPVCGTILTFDDIVNSRPNELYRVAGDFNFYVDGYRISAQHAHVIDSLDCEFGGCVSFTGTQYYAFDGPGPAHHDPPLSPLIISRADGALFRLVSLDVSQLFNDGTAAAAGNFPNATMLEIETGMGLLTYTVPPGPAYTTIRPPDDPEIYTNEIFIQGTRIPVGGGWPRSGSWAADNIVLELEGANVVPEPSALLLTLTALASVFLLRRVKR
ncbi:MAG: PEP-CTERM sorting domain-containing protein [Bryobacteraceae bacterium]|nr:PEP-CTERM sorting domain-containing protein [Bryobacteraceae bacterium]